MAIVVHQPTKVLPCPRCVIQRIGLMLSLEGMEPLGYDPGLIDVFCALGVRMDARESAGEERKDDGAHQRFTAL